AVRGHCQINGAFFVAFGRSVFQFPLATEIAFGWILWPVEFANFEFLAVDKNHFDFCLFSEEIAVGDGQVRDFAFFDGTGAVGNAKDFGGGQSKGANGGVWSKARVDGFLNGFENVRWSGDAVGSESKFHSGFRESGGRRRRPVTETKCAKTWNVVG